MAQELNIRLNSEDKKPLYRQIYEYIRREIRSGALEAGERLPSTRALSSDLHVARSTAELAYSQLLSEGYIRAKKNSGYYVNEIENLAELHFEESVSDIAEAGRSTGADATAYTMPNAAMNAVSNATANFMANAASNTTANALTNAASNTMPNARPSLSRLGRQGLLDSDLIDFSLRHTEMSVFPYSTWKKIMREVMVDANSEMFSHSEPGGDLTLRTTIAHYLHFSRGVRCTPEQVIVGAGNDYLLMLLRHILGEGRRVAMENPSYLRAAQIFSSFGYKICPVRMDEDGMLPDSLTFSGADLVYAMPAHQFPVGCIMPVGRRATLLGWATDAPGRYIIEDDYDSEFRYRGKPIPALQSLDHAGRVIYIGTFSKAIAPAIRISYMILPPELLSLYHEKCWFFSSTVSRIDQRILNEFMKNGHFERHLNRMRSLYRARHDELLAQLRLLQDRFRVLGAGTGLHLVLETRPATAARIAQSMAAGYDRGSGSSETGSLIAQSMAQSMAAGDGRGSGNSEPGARIAQSMAQSMAAGNGRGSGSSEIGALIAQNTVKSTESPEKRELPESAESPGKRELPEPVESLEKREFPEPAESFSPAKIEEEIVRRAAAKGVAVYAMSDYLLPGSSGKEASDAVPETVPDEKDWSSNTEKRHPAVLLGFGALDESAIREGVRRLSEALALE